MKSLATTGAKRIIDQLIKRIKIEVEIILTSTSPEKSHDTLNKSQSSKLSDVTQFWVFNILKKERTIPHL